VIAGEIPCGVWLDEPAPESPGGADAALLAAATLEAIGISTLPAAVAGATRVATGVTGCAVGKTAGEASAAASSTLWLGFTIELAAAEFCSAGVEAFAAIAAVVAGDFVAARWELPADAPLTGPVEPARELATAVAAAAACWAGSISPATFVSEVGAASLEPTAVPSTFGGCATAGVLSVVVDSGLATVTSSPVGGDGAEVDTVFWLDA
jgi:hypothetical protein